MGLETQTRMRLDSRCSVTKKNITGLETHLVSSPVASPALSCAPHSRRAPAVAVAFVGLCKPLWVFIDQPSIGCRWLALDVGSHHTSNYTKVSK
jgi:hypothetical protein